MRHVTFKFSSQASALENRICLMIDVTLPEIINFTVNVRCSTLVNVDHGDVGVWAEPRDQGGGGGGDVSGGVECQQLVRMIISWKKFKILWENKREVIEKKNCSCNPRRLVNFEGTFQISLSVQNSLLWKNT